MDFLIIQGCRVQMTCSACPEQYDVYFGDTQIGYLRLRHGAFRADYPDYTGDAVYTAYPKGDGVFEDSERMKYLKAAVRALIRKHNRTVLKNQYKVI